MTSAWRTEESEVTFSYKKYLRFFLYKYVLSCFVVPYLLHPIFALYPIFIFIICVAWIQILSIKYMSQFRYVALIGLVASFISDFLSVKYLLFDGTANATILIYVSIGVITFISVYRKELWNKWNGEWLTENSKV